MALHGSRRVRAEYIRYKLLKLYCLNRGAWEQLVGWHFQETGKALSPHGSLRVGKGLEEGGYHPGEGYQAR